MGKQWKQCQTLFFGAPESLQTVIAAMKLKDACSLEKKAMTNLDSIFADKGLYSQSYGFLVVMYGCESWTIKKAECRKSDAFQL